VPEHVSIAYRGANYAIGQGPQFYGIWHASALQSPPIEWWPLSPEGWTGAWARFASIEVPGTIGPVQQRPLSHGVAAGAAGGPSAGAGLSAGPGQSAGAGQSAPTGSANAGPPAADFPLAGPVRAPAPAGATWTARIAAAILGLGVVLGIVSLFPVYVGSGSLASQPPNLVTHVGYLVAWSASAILIASGRGRLRAGALLGVGVSAVTLGLFFADLGTRLSSGVHLAVTGLVIGILGWLACTAGVVLALRTSLRINDGNEAVARRGLARHLGRSASQEIVPLVALVLAAVGTAIAFAPSWDSFKLTANGVSQVVTAGNAFANPAPVILGDVLVMAAIVVVAIIAALWRPTRLGGALVAGAIVPMVAQIVSAIVLLREPTSPLQFGISQAQAGRLGLTISNGLTPMFWVFCAFVATMILLCVWMLISRESTPLQAFPYGGGPVSAAPADVTAAPGQPAESQPTSP
jgi:hypothetical protein